MKKILVLTVLILSFSIAGICQEDGFIETKHGVIHYKKYGTGEPLLIINGGPGLDCAGFVPLAELLSDKYMTIVYDQRGTGESVLNQIDSTTVTTEKMANDIETIRNFLKIEKWFVLGHSFGGWMAEYYVIYYPETIKAMIFQVREVLT